MGRESRKSNASILLAEWQVLPRLRVPLMRERKATACRSKSVLSVLSV